MACIFCGQDSPHDYDDLREPAPTEEQLREWQSRHGRGICVTACDWCRLGVPHSGRACTSAAEERRAA